MLVTHTKDLTSAQKQISTMVSVAAGLIATVGQELLLTNVCTYMHFTGNRVGSEKGRQT